MTVEEALEFFDNLPAASAASCRPCTTWVWTTSSWASPAPQLSGGEAQRIKLATELSRRDTGTTRCTCWTSPPPACMWRMWNGSSAFCSGWWTAGNSVLVIEHNLDVIKTADYLIDLGPEGGDGGGKIVAIGTPEEVVRCKKSYTGQYLAPILKRDRERMEKQKK